MEACVACARPVCDGRFRGRHWLCRAHRRRHASRALAAYGSPPTLAALLRSVVFAFPVECGMRECEARVAHAAGVWGGTLPHKQVIDVYGLKGRVAGPRAVVTRCEAAALLEPLVAFVFRCAAPPEVLAGCAGVVRAYYPALIDPTCVRRMLLAERILHHGRRDFLVLADLAVALPQFDVHVRHTLYLAYARAIRVAKPDEKTAGVYWGLFLGKWRARTSLRASSRSGAVGE